MEFIENYWLLIAIGLAAAVAVAWYVFHATRRTGIAGERRDVLDEGASPAARNQALIDTPAPAPAPSVMPMRTADPVVAPAAPSPLPPTGDRATGTDLDRIKGIGPKLISELGALGIHTIDQVAAWTDADVARIDSQLGRFQGRIVRDEWVAQATLLTQGDSAGYASRFGNSS